jgi:hypothetical protein
MGGSFGAGFLSGSLGSYLGSSRHSKNMSEMIGNTARDFLEHELQRYVGF